MKIRTTKYIIKEGILNAYRNKLMSLASLSIIIASLFVLGVFFLATATINKNLKGLKEQPEIQVFCIPELDDTQVKQVEDNIKSDPKIQDYRIVSKEEALEKAKKDLLSGRENVLDGINDDFLPVSFIIKLKDSKDGSEVVAYYKKVDGVENVTYPQLAIKFITRITYWIPLISLIFLIILLVVSMFIISNTIKLTVFARRREINIMKYVGATDWFIRWPFIIEGVIIGLIGSVLAFVLVAYSYNALAGVIIGASSDIGAGLVKFVSLKEVGIQIIAVFSLIGVFVGTIGSTISIRKYLHV